MMRSAAWMMRSLMLVFLASLLVACQGESDSFDPEDPAKGPGQMVGNDSPIIEDPFTGYDDQLPEARTATPPDGEEPPDCDGECQSYCEDLDLQNPVNRGLCADLWGVGLEHRPIETNEACRRLYADTIGRFPTHDEVREVCQDRNWDEVAADLIDSEEFVELNQRFWADRLLYNNVAVNVERIFDADDLVGKLYRGEIAYDHFAAVVSAHPVITRRYDTPGDRAEAVFEMLMGRPPHENERSDLARLYTLWHNGYYDHPRLGDRIPDAFIEYECVTDDGEVDPDSKGACTSVLWGYNELILEPDLRARGDSDQLWSGLLRAEEWEKLQMPGRILASQRGFWEKAVDDVLEQYFDYDLGTQAPRVRDELVDHLIANEGDIRSVHFAVATSAAYLQSAQTDQQTPYRWTRGPLKQVHAETWLDSVSHTTDRDLSDCDHRLPEPDELINSDRLGALSLVKHSDWEFDEEGNLRTDYRDLARTLGGCPRNESASRFRIVSILTTSQQLNFVDEVCDPALESDSAADPEALLPDGVGPKGAVDPDLATDIVSHQTRKFFSREPTEAELDEAQSHGEACEREVCTAEEFARPSCFALLSSSEMLFY
ncbi:MAG: hypothetical protein ACOCV2_04205 [Persicimonas sp.]